MFVILMIGAQVNTDAKPYQIVHFKYIGFIVLQFYLKEVKEAMKKEEIVEKKRVRIGRQIRTKFF